MSDADNPRGPSPLEARGAADREELCPDALPLSRPPPPREGSWTITRDTARGGPSGCDAVRGLALAGPGLDEELGGGLDTVEPPGLSGEESPWVVVEAAAAADDDDDDPRPAVAVVASLVAAAAVAVAVAVVVAVVGFGGDPALLPCRSDISTFTTERWRDEAGGKTAEA